MRCLSSRALRSKLLAPQAQTRGVAAAIVWIPVFLVLTGQLRASQLTVLDPFRYDPNPAFPSAPAVLGPDGRLYGATSEGGQYNTGTIWSVNPDGSSFRVLHEFSADPGRVNSRQHTASEPLFAPDGWLYGTTAEGGAHGGGTIWRIRPDGSGFLRLHEFDPATDRGRPLGAPVWGPDGNLYGANRGSGSKYSQTPGSVWRIRTDGSGFSVLRIIGPQVEGGVPIVRPTFGPDGQLYGLIGPVYIGSRQVWRMSPDGTLFTLLRDLEAPDAAGQPPPLGVWRMNADGTDHQLLRAFDRTDASELNPLVFGPDGKLYGAINTTLRVTPGGRLYGTVRYGGNQDNGYAWSMESSGSGFVVLHSLNGDTEGAFPLGPPAADPAGTLFGISGRLGPKGAGTLWTLRSDGTGFAVLRAFGSVPNVALPNGPPALGDDGFLYSTSASGGPANAGTVWRIKPDGSQFQVLHAFDGALGGREPYDPPVLGLDNRLYGTTYAGGMEGGGTFWRLERNGTGFTVIKHFTTADGGPPFGTLVMDPGGRVFGTSSAPGAGAEGTLWSIAHDGSGFRVHRRLHPTAEGAEPAFGASRPREGWLYGTSRSGGAGNAGTIWRLRTDGSGFAVLHPLTPNTDGARPAPELVFAPDGAVYGATFLGGRLNGGTLWSMAPTGGSFRVLRALAEYGELSEPHPGFVRDGFLYGAATRGGPQQWGSLWRVGLDGTSFTLLHTFEGPDGLLPSGAPAVLPDGRLYGAAIWGGAAGTGLVYLWSTAGPSASFSVVPAAPVVGQTVTFDASASTEPGGGGLVYDWTFGDGSPGVTLARQPGTTHTYTNPGSYTASLRVTNAAGVSSTVVSRSVTVSASPHVTLIENGDFSTALTGWIATGNQRIVAGPPYTSGSNSIVVFNDGDQRPDGVLHRTLSTRPGLLYLLQFDVGVLSYNRDEQRIRVSVSGLKPLLSETVSMRGVGGGLATWNTHAFLFLADGFVAELEFTDVSPTTKSIDLLLDHVQVTAAVLPFRNGSFEAGYAGWIASGNQRLATEGPYTLSDGATAVVFNDGNRTPDAVLAQTFSTTPGRTYTVRLDVGVLAYNRNEQRVQITVTGASVLLSRTVSVSGVGRGMTRWFEQTFTFTANSSESTLRFSDVSPTSQSIDLLLDRIRIE